MDSPQIKSPSIVSAKTLEREPAFPVLFVMYAYSMRMNEIRC